jgi:hypothetical protein
MFRSKPKEPVQTLATDLVKPDSEVFYDLEAFGGLLRFDSAVALQVYVETSEAAQSADHHNNPRSRAEVVSSIAVQDGMPLVEDPIAIATAAKNIDEIIGELRNARDELMDEAERVYQLNLRYTRVAEMAATSARETAEILRQWIDQARQEAFRDDD